MSDSRALLDQKKFNNHLRKRKREDAEPALALTLGAQAAVTFFREPALQKLLLHVVHGEQSKAEDIIKNQPELLFKTDTVQDYSWRTILNVTPITAAYGADDIDMLEMMFTYLDKDSRDKAIRDINEKFPEEKEYKTIYSDAGFQSFINVLMGTEQSEKPEPEPYNFRPIIIAIAANENVEAILAQFRNDFKPGVIEKGKHFNMRILLAAYKAYFQLSQESQRALFFREVIGYLQRLLPACYAQAFCQGLGFVAVEQRSFCRRLKLDDGSFFYPGIETPELKLDGVYSYGYASYPTRNRKAWYAVEQLSNALDALENIYRAKTLALRDLRENPHHRPKPPCCVIL